MYRCEDHMRVSESPLMKQDAVYREYSRETPKDPRTDRGDESKMSEDDQPEWSESIEEPIYTRRTQCHHREQVTTRETIQE